MGRPRVFVIDDEQALRDAIADRLRMDGLDVQTATDGKVGLELIGRNPFDVIFCDLLMPSMVQQLRQVVMRMTGSGGYAVR